ncbi:hypothetical protein PUNSTDRAFT_53245 [Punctularia strigosozonata HHB-11173 SS5]|uniref:uncharacterized protein n=1 Tax=Punctularia strigosozonata (strain HHB-11173) TaxID=741275 RepID=UPI0004417545|nr:uncharacterized protein PUNSTDRAFT_53245 [Punctularia strigosozonata HHB-11173 SS5]EIN07905.1 hypothetical protein PUNSTDRAFT_53245 [Punctularia strigosozonata HHB-11173 SS5]
MGEERYPHPFTEKEQGEYYDSDEEGDSEKDNPRTLIELRMCALSATIREKPEWYNKFRDAKIQEKWRKEIQEQQADLHDSQKLTSNMVNYIMEELDAYAALRDAETGIEAGPYEKIWRSDQLIPPSLKASLVQAVLPLESVPDDQKDWHPGSDGQVLDLVHPSLYPIVYRWTVRTTGEIVDSPDEDDMFTSVMFQWLPSDFDVSSDGSVRLASPYINNVHPNDHRDLMNVIPQVLQQAVPMFERVLSDLSREKPLPTRIELGDRKFPACVWPDGDVPNPSDDDDDDEQWYDNQPKVWPESKPHYAGSLDEVQRTVSLHGQRLQVIVKLANIVLTPDKPEYPGGKWHVEGMRNESIVSSFIYYYDCGNTTESRLSFRHAVAEPRYHCQDDSYCMKHLYGIDRDDPCVQEVGSVITKQDRCIAFPNLYQHQVSPFKLADPTKPGHRKILVFFLVDPHVKVPSATDVAPQQRSWVRRAMGEAPAGSLWNKLPVEILDYIANYSFTMSEDEAKQYRLELMKERTVFVDTVNEERFGQEFNMCEH